MQEWIQLFIDGLTIGGVYAVIALGYTLVYGVLRMINFAHGELFMMGAFTGYYTLNGFEKHSSLNDQVPVFTIGLAIVLGMVVAVVLAILMERIAYRPLRHAPRLAPLISAIGVSIFLRNVMLRVTEAQGKVYPAVFPRTTIEYGQIHVLYVQIFLITLSLVFLLLLYLFIERTKIGTAIRAVAEDRGTAALMGINVDRTIVMTFVAGAALAGASGVVYGMYVTTVTSGMGFIPGIKAFTAAVLGGIGSVPGAVAGGYFLGITESLTTKVFGAQYKDVVAFVLLVGVLIFRPWGIFGKREDKRA
ncbi:MAG TPA: branched-chain amino acid ABC transporter permease [Dehalococcoidia bacterium]|nr:branched-chain amino acid ABC transporter permease [Dehalococcoidia bacterium]